MPYSSKAITNFFLELAEKEGRQLTPMKIQKLVYYAHGWHLAITNEPLVNEQVEAWRWGPVLPELYHDLKHCGNFAVREKLHDFNYDGGEVRQYTPTVGPRSDPSGATRKLLEKVWSTYGHYSPVQLSNMTHEPGTPWDQVSKEHGGAIPLHTDIPTETSESTSLRWSRSRGSNERRGRRCD